MGAAKAGRVHFGPRHALAGLEAGVIGALTMLVLVALGSIFYHRSIWLAPNLFGTTFVGSDGYRNAYGPGSLAGIALFVAIYGLFGLIWGVFDREERAGEQKRGGMTLFGAIAGLGIYYAMFHLVWRHVNPLITLYAPDRQLEAGHILWGMIVAQSPKFARGIARATVETRIESETILVSQP